MKSTFHLNVIGWSSLAYYVLAYPNYHGQYLHAFFMMLFGYILGARLVHRKLEQENPDAN